MLLILAAVVASPAWGEPADLAEAFRGLAARRFEPGVCAAADPSAAAAAAFLRRGDPAPDFSGRDLFGLNLRLSEYRGRVVLLDFWASWCGPCRQTAPMVSGLADYYQDSGLAVIGVNEDDDAGRAREFSNSHRLGYPSLYDSNRFVQSQYNIRSYPSFVLIGRNGEFLMQIVGVVDIRKVVAETLKAQFGQGTNLH